MIVKSNFLQGDIMKKFNIFAFIYILILFILLTIGITISNSTYYTSIEIDSYSPLFFAQTIFIYLSPIYIVFLCVIYLFIPEKQNLGKKLFKTALPIGISLLLLIIPITKIVDSRYLNTNIFAAIKFEDDNVESVQKLVDANTVNSKNFEGISTLAFALIHEKFKIADYLVKNGASLNISNQLAIKNNDGEIIIDFNKGDAQKFLNQHKNK